MASSQDHTEAPLQKFKQAPWRPRSYRSNEEVTSPLRLLPTLCDKTTICHKIIARTYCCLRMIRPEKRVMLHTKLHLHYSQILLELGPLRVVVLGDKGQGKAHETSASRNYTLLGLHV